MPREEEPPPGWRRPAIWEPQGGSCRICASVIYNKPQSTKTAAQPFDFFGCGAPRAKEEEDDDWNPLSAIEQWFCSKPRADSPVEDLGDEEEPTLPAGTEAAFTQAVYDIKNWKPNLYPPSDEEKLRVYALYKQATIGRCRADRPPPFDPIACAKFDAWARLKGMAKGRAMLSYIAEAKRQMANDSAARAM